MLRTKNISATATTFSDRKIPKFSFGGSTIDAYYAELLSAQDYYRGVCFVFGGRSVIPGWEA